MGDLLRLKLPVPVSATTLTDRPPAPLLSSMTARCPGCGAEIRVPYDADLDEAWDLVSTQFRFFRQGHARCDDVWSRLGE